jgi:hypothetical protein
MEPEPIHRVCRFPRCLQFSLRGLLLAVLVVAAYFAGWATARRRAEDVDRQLAVLTQALGEDAANALKAKSAVIELVRMKPTSFEGCDPEDFARLPLNEMGNDGMWSFGCNTIDLRQLTYTCMWFYTADRLEAFEYCGKLAIEGQHWKAQPPKKARVRFQRTASQRR